ncbi:MAG: hypothetical protein EXS63_08465 [Candidatus Omnitrophica bacterium]|nr:hypothetical protein [Candidatus Omnitrophota bacterium]
MERLQDRSHIHIIEGLRGTTILFSPNILHRAVVPETGHRDVIVFEIMPSAQSKMPYRGLHFTGFEYWKNSWDFLFGRKTPLKVGKPKGQRVEINAAF